MPYWLSRIASGLGVDETLRAAVHKVQAASARREVASLKERSPTLEEALSEALANRLDPAEEDWVRRVETLRRKLHRCTDTMAAYDYGAGPGGTLDVTVGERCRRASKPYFWSLLLMKLVRKFRPLRCVELGTCLGISAAYQGAALAINADGGTLTTIEGCPQTAQWASRNLSGLGLGNATVVAGLFENTLPAILEDPRPVDYVFVDGHHDGPATLEYFDLLRPHLSERSLVIFDDISWSVGMRDAWSRLKMDPRVLQAVDFRKVGVCVVGKGGSSPGAVFRIPLI